MPRQVDAEHAVAMRQVGGQRGEVGPAADGYSLGATLYALVTGRPPFQAARPMDTLLAVLETDPPVPRSIDRRIDRDIEMVALKSLQKPSDLRYASAGALAADLRAFLAGETVAASRGGLADVVARLFRETHHAVVLENWGLLWMWHSVVVLALSVTTDVLAWQGVTTRWPRPASPTRPDSCGIHAGAEIAGLTRYGDEPITDLALVGSRLYVEVMHALVRGFVEMGCVRRDARVTVINDQIGRMRQDLRAWLALAPSREDRS